MSSDDKEGDYSRFKKFDGNEDKWYQWSLKTLAYAKLEGYKQAFVKDMNPCSNLTGKKTTDEAIKKIYKMNDCTYQHLFISVDGIAFGIVELARMDENEDGNAFLAWSNLLAFYTPRAKQDLIKLTGEFTNCVYDSKLNNLEEWFVKLEVLRNKIKAINASFANQDMELIAHIMKSLPKEYSEVITTIEGIHDLTLKDMAKLQAFYKCRLKDKKPGEIALLAYTKFKGTCQRCGKQ